MSWPEQEFGTLYAVPSKNGLTRPARVRGAGYKMINMGELFANDWIGNIDMERVLLNGRELLSMLVESGDLLFARQSLVLAGAGKCSIVAEVGEPTTFESHIIRVRLKRHVANPQFFHYYLQSPTCRMRSIVTQGVQAGIRASDLRRLRVHVPPIAEQDRIASVLSAYDNLITKNRRRIQLLEEAARLLYKEWFVDLRFPGHEHVTSVDGVLEGWEQVPLSRICIDTRGSTRPQDLPGATPYIGLEHIPRRSITLESWGTARTVESAKFRFQRGDILFGKIRPYFHKVALAQCDGITSSDAIVIRAQEERLHRFALFLLASDEFVTLASKTVREGSKMPRADWAYLLRCRFLLPPPGILEAFNENVTPIVHQLANLAFQNRQLAYARDLLLPKFMNGEIAA